MKMRSNSAGGEKLDDGLDEGLMDGEYDGDSLTDGD
jgi:hypothetical protein